MKKRQVKTEAGILEGVFGYDPRVIVFKGVPYAAPPVGELRWKEPQPVVPWEGVRKADTYGPISMQPVPGLYPDDFWTREIHPTGPEFEMSEDCLYVNVYTPARTGKENLPVLFYIHGGGYKGGYPYEVEFDWEHMARKGMVVVAVTYRLGVMGFLAHPDLTEESPGASQGNFGLLDQIAALEWTKRNIKEFGGNPNQITVAGQSAGAGSVQCLLTAKKARSLINGAIIESGITMDFKDSNVPMQPFELETAYDNAKKLFEKAGVTSVEEARKLDAAELVRIEDREMEPGFHFQPVIDHVLLDETPSYAFIHDTHTPVPVLCGYNLGETKAFEAMGTDLMEGSYFFGCLQQMHGHKTYIYEFNPDIPGEDNPGSYHGCEMWFAYDSLARSWRPFTGKHYDLARKTSSYWTNFIRTGNPNGEDFIGEPLTNWPVFTAEYPGMMNFTDDTNVKLVDISEDLKKRMLQAAPEMTFGAGKGSDR